jgi:hypothetical protein
MTRRYDDPVDVRRGDDAPEQFLWRGRLYVVRDVLGHWVETGAWWRAPSARSVYAGDVYAGDPAPVVGAERFAGSLEGASPEFDGGSVGTLVDDSEREVWRVEASAGRAAGSGVYDLGFDWSACAWTLLRALD